MRSQDKISSQSLCIILMSATFLYRFLLCLEVPLVSSDVYRHLGFTAQLFGGLDFSSFYTATPRQFLPAAWATKWTDEMYLYPPLAVYFFSVFAYFHLGIFWVKSCLTFIDLLSAILFFRYVSPLAGVLFSIAPLSIFYTSHEGQFEALQTFLILLSALSIYGRRWFSAGILFSTAIQIKLFGVLLFPWIIFRLWQSAERRFRNCLLFVTGAFLGILPGIPFYWHSPTLFFSPLKSINTAVLNPFFWNPVNLNRFDWIPNWLIWWNSSISTFLLIYLLFYAIGSRDKLQAIASLIPLAAFWGIVKSLLRAQFWYALVSPGFLFCFLENKKLIIYLLFLFMFLDGHSISMILGARYGHIETIVFRELMSSCMFKCSLLGVP